ncbi:hypothetical protein GCM10029964_012360 [Kibdelosporangium lantanae]
MVGTFANPVQVPITMPSTSPIAHPVKQCKVADAAIPQLAFIPNSSQVPPPVSEGTPRGYPSSTEVARVTQASLHSWA